MSNILFLKNLNDLTNINKDTGKIIIIKVGADWCGPCKNITPLYNQMANSNNNSNIIFAEINASDADEELLDYIDVKSLPTFLFYKNNTLNNKIIGCDKIQLATTINNLFL
jgi:thioredoxin 1